LILDALPCLFLMKQAWQTALVQRSGICNAFEHFNSPICVQEARANASTKQKCLSLARSLGKSSAVARSLSPYEAADPPQVYLLLS